MVDKQRDAVADVALPLGRGQVVSHAGQVQHRAGTNDEVVQNRGPGLPVRAEHAAARKGVRPLTGEVMTYVVAAHASVGQVEGRGLVRRVDGREGDPGRGRRGREQREREALNFLHVVERADPSRVKAALLQKVSEPRAYTGLSFFHRRTYSGDCVFRLARLSRTLVNAVRHTLPHRCAPLDALEAHLRDRTLS